MPRRSKDLPSNSRDRLAALLSPERRHELARKPAVRVRARSGFGRIRDSAWVLVQTAVAAALAWFLATEVLDHESAFFAPVAAIIALGATRGQRVRQALEMMLGVAVGIGVADLLVRLTGTGAWQLGLFVALALAAAIVLSPGRMLSTEAAVSAALVATVAPEAQGVPPERFIDALIGGAVALLFSQLLFPVHPVRVVREALESILGDLAGTLDDIADALERRDLGAASETLVKARRISDDWSDVEHALDAGREAARFAPQRRGLQSRFADVDDVGLPLDLTVGDARVLARGAVRALTIGDAVPEGVPAAIHDLARAARELAGEFASGHEDAEVRKAALRATTRATAALPTDEHLSASILVGQVQAASADMLRSLGMGHKAAHGMVGEAAVAAQGEQSGDHAPNGDGAEGLPRVPRDGAGP
jgi:Fusaric acid resistance protein-like